MAITLVASVTAVPGANGGTTSAINTSGATLIVVSIAWYGGGAAPVLSDVKGNTYTLLTDHAGGGNLSSHRLFYKLAPTVGAGHTFTAVGAGSSPAVLAYAFGGVASYQTESGAGQNSGSSLASGSVTPNANGALIFTGDCGYNPVTDSVTPPGFTLTQVTAVGGVNMQGSVAYYVQPVAAPINPTWSFSPAQSFVSVGTAVFLPAAEGGGGGGGTMPQGVNEKMAVYFDQVLYVGTDSTDLTTNIIRRLQALSGEMTARFKQIIVAAGSSN